MDSEKPKQDPPSDPSEKDAARRRVEHLTETDTTGRDSGDRSRSGPDPGDRSRSERDSGDRSRSERDSGDRSKSGRDSGDGSGPSGEAGSPSPPRLTERQRREAREKRRQERRGGRRPGRRPGSAAAGSKAPSGNPLSRGVRATWHEVRRTAGFIWGLFLSGLDRLGPAVRFVAAGLVALLAAARRGLVRLVHAVGTGMSLIGSFLLTLDRFITPRRALVAVAAAAAGALVVSQFTDFRATEIGQTGYDQILDIARAPRTDVITPTAAHSVALLLAAAAALAGIAGFAVTGRRIFAGTVALAGVATVAVSLLIDLPRAFDVGEAEISYSEVAAVLLSGFWIQLGAGLVLAVGGLGLILLAGANERTTAGREAGSQRQRSAPGGQRPSSARAGGVS